MTKLTTSLTVLAAVLALTLGIASDAGPAYGGYQSPEAGSLVVLEGTETPSVIQVEPKDEKEGESCNHD